VPMCPGTSYFDRRRGEKQLSGSLVRILKTEKSNVGCKKEGGRHSGTKGAKIGLDLVGGEQKR